MSNEPLADDFEEAEGSVVRAFVLTGGRTRSTGVQVAMESLIDQRSDHDKKIDKLKTVQRQIWDLTENRISAAEISAHLNLPLRTVFVLVGDMATAGLLEVHETASTGDVALVRRLIDGVRAL